MEANWTAYDLSAFETTSGILPSDAPHTRAEFEAELRSRLETEKQKKELIVNYYRVYRRFAFPLPVTDWYDNVPVGVENITLYPFSIWLLWALRERWDTLLAGCALFRDAEAEKLLEAELGAAFRWKRTCIGYPVYLGTAHFAMCVSRCLALHVFPEEVQQRFRRESEAFLKRTFLPWFRDPAVRAKKAPEEALHNIHVIQVFSALALAEQVSFPESDVFREAAGEIFTAFADSKRGDAPFTEMPPYDCYALDALTEYLEEAGEGSRGRFASCAAAADDVLRAAVYSGLPGRPDLLAPIGDAEPEMMLHAPVLLRFARWYRSAPALDCFLKIPLCRMPSWAVFDILRDPPQEKPAPFSSLHDLSAGTAVLRTGFSSGDILCAVSLCRCSSWHVHYDCGSFVLGFGGKFFVTDPGYQQYLSGDEREYTIGPRAHNTPVISGIAESARNLSVLRAEDGRLLLDLTGCYRALPDGARVTREFLLNAQERLLTVTDSFSGLPNASAEYRFTVNPFAAFRHENGALRLTDGRNSVTISARKPITPRDARFVPGSRGPVTLDYREELPAASEARISFVFRMDTAVSDF